MAKYSVHRENTKNISLSFDDVDLTGATVYFTVKSTPDDDPDDTAAIIAIDVTDHIDAANGQTAIHLTPEDTDKEPGKYRYDIKLKKANGDQVTVDTGEFRILEVITNRG